MAASIQSPTGSAGLSPWLLLAPLIIYLGIFFIVPLADVFIMSVTDPTTGLDNYRAVFTSPLYLKVMFNTFLTALLVTATCLVLSYPLAYLMANSSERTALILIVWLTLSFWTSFLVRTYAWMVILGNQGPVVWLIQALGISEQPRILFTRFSSTLAMVHILAPYMIMSIYTVMRKIDPSLVKSAESLGARGGSVFRHVYLPLTAPGIANGCVLVFIICLGFYVTPVLLGSPREQMIAGLIGDQIEEFLAFGMGGAISMVLLTITLAILAVYHRRFGLDKLWG